MHPRLPEVLAAHVVGLEVAAGHSAKAAPLGAANPGGVVGGGGEHAEARVAPKRHLAASRGGRDAGHVVERRAHRRHACFIEALHIFFYYLECFRLELYIHAAVCQCAALEHKLARDEHDEARHRHGDDVPSKLAEEDSIVVQKLHIVLAEHEALHHIVLETGCKPEHEERNQGGDDDPGLNVLHHPGVEPHCILLHFNTTKYYFGGV